ncbi:MAG: dihydrodipicolinate synthase family protein, partial [Planctomycetota bacterium]
MKRLRLRGLVAATYTPLDPNGRVNTSAIAPVVERLLGDGVSGLYVCGSTGEGMSLTTSERKLVLEAYFEAANGRTPVIAQIGHNSLAEACELSSHAQDVGVDAISATCPSYFKVGDVETLTACMKTVADAAQTTPFYYYHIPSLTGSLIGMPEFLATGSKEIPNLVGLKYTDTKLFEFQECLEINDGQFDVVWGCDEMLLGALATGATAAIGSTYNVAAPLYVRLMEAFSAGDHRRARDCQSLSVKLVRTLSRYPFHPAMKAVLAMHGLALG